MSDQKKTPVNPLPLKERMKILRHGMPEQEPHDRAHNFKEVNLGYDPELAKSEALRCIEVPRPGSDHHAFAPAKPLPPVFAEQKHQRSADQ
jgi:hypothetical protein